MCDGCGGGVRVVGDTLGITDGGGSGGGGVRVCCCDLICGGSAGDTEGCGGCKG